MTHVAQRAQFRKLFIALHSSLWFVPALIIIAAIALFILLTEIDRRFGQQLHDWSQRLFFTEADGAREMLSVIAGSMATIAGVVFSITIVALSLASTQYTSRVLRNFMRDRATQSVLGVFVGVYVYCLLVLRTINSDGGSVPTLAVIGGLVLAVVAIGFFIFFIHHISASIQASEITAAVTRETLQAIDNLYPREVCDEEQQLPDDMAALTWQSIPAQAMGYIESVDTRELLNFAREKQTMLRMECSIGEFIAPGQPLVSLALDHAPDQKTIAWANHIFAVSSYRTIEQDAAFGIRQLVDISLKALSPGVNDTTTAVTCIEHIAVVLERCVQRRMVAPCIFDEGKPRVISKGPSFDGLVTLAFSQIIEIAESNTEILLQILSAIERVGKAAKNPQRITILRNWIDVVDEISERNAKSSHARHRLTAHLRHARMVLAAGAEGNCRHCFLQEVDINIHDTG